VWIASHGASLVAFSFFFGQFIEGGRIRWDPRADWFWLVINGLVLGLLVLITLYNGFNGFGGEGAKLCENGGGKVAGWVS